MKKKRISLTALLLCLTLLCGCAGKGSIADVFGGGGSLAESFSALTAGEEGAMPRFSQIEYERPSVEAFDACCDAVLAALEEGANYGKLTRLLDACYDSYYSFDTMHTVADIRSSQDMTDEFYSAEYAWCQENYSLLQQSFEEVYRACAASDHARRLEDNYFWPGFCEEYGEDSQSYYYAEAISLMQQENAVLSRFRSLTAAPTVEVDGVVYDYNDYIAELEGEEYTRVNTLYYEQHNEELAEVYIELVSIRNELAAELGFESYEQMQYVYSFERDYGPEDMAQYNAQVKRYIVPLYEEAVASGVYNEIYYDYVDEDGLLAVVGSAMGLMGEEISEAFDFMLRYELCDVSHSSRKLNLSFQTYLSDYNAPYLFMSPYCDSTDYLTLAHEFGHYADAYINYNAYHTIDLAETYSQAMEYLLLFYLGDMPSEEQENLWRIKLMDTLELYVQQCSFAEFESRVYELGADALSAELLNELSLQLAVDYGYFEPGYETYYAMSWSDIWHFFESPFYVVSYPVPNDIALQIYELERQQSGAGVEMFCKMLSPEYETLIDTALAVGLESPFEPGRVEQIAKDARAELMG